MGRQTVWVDWVDAWHRVGVGVCKRSRLAELQVAVAMDDLNEKKRKGEKHAEPPPKKPKAKAKAKPKTNNEADQKWKAEAYEMKGRAKDDDEKDDDHDDVEGVPGEASKVYSTAQHVHVHAWVHLLQETAEPG